MEKSYSIKHSATDIDMCLVLPSAITVNLCTLQVNDHWQSMHFIARMPVQPTTLPVLCSD